VLRKINDANITKREGLTEKGLSFGGMVKTVNNTLKPEILSYFD
jgi:hypothetical protein